MSFFNNLTNLTSSYTFPLPRLASPPTSPTVPEHSNQPTHPSLTARRTFPLDSKATARIPLARTASLERLIETKWESADSQRNRAKIRVTALRAQYNMKLPIYNSHGTKESVTTTADLSSRHDSGATEGKTGHDKQHSYDGVAQRGRRNSVAMSDLDRDFLWLTVTFIPHDPDVTRTCEYCKSDLPRRYGLWRMFSCGHYYHISCFRNFLFDKNREAGRTEERNQSDNTDESDYEETRKKKRRCYFCDTLWRWAQSLPEAEVQELVTKLEQGLVPYKRVSCASESQARKTDVPATSLPRNYTRSRNSAI
jgi:hypothetical protein